MKYETFDGAKGVIDPKIIAKAKKIKFIGFDFDGVFTDGKVIVRQDENESVVCSRRDGLGFDMLKKAGIECRIISKEANPVVAARAKKLRIPYHQGIVSGQKLTIFKESIEQLGIKPTEAAYMADDVNDLPTLRFAGLSIGVADAHPQVRKIVDVITLSKGGHHAIREAIEIILMAQGKDPAKLID